MIYESANGTGAPLKRILVDDGYIGGDAYYFYLTDHLGKNHVITSASGSIVLSNHYYPFGMTFAEGITASQQPYKYNDSTKDFSITFNLDRFDKITGIQHKKSNELIKQFIKINLNG